ncbi:hypothetical protein [Streptomyces yangpuensis]|uniref:hypothetical protein n=1 Tax=Streptomyces yangpuensis TaxID=1648182 RepID=UPI003718FBA6
MHDERDGAMDPEMPTPPPAVHTTPTDPSGTPAARQGNASEPGRQRHPAPARRRGTARKASREDLVVFLSLLGAGVVLICVGRVPVTALVGFAAGLAVLFEAWNRRDRGQH